MFLSTYENKLDKKGRVSVPASFRSYLSNLGYNGVVCYPSFNNQSIEAWPQDRIEKISNAIDALNPFEEKKDYFATSILSESINLQFDSEGRISLTPKLLKHAKITTKNIKSSSNNRLEVKNNIGTINIHVPKNIRKQFRDFYLTLYIKRGTPDSNYTVNINNYFNNYNIYQHQTK